MTRARGFAAWKPQKHTVDLLGQVETVLAEYREHLPLTIRQVFYRLVGKHNYDKTESAYSRLCETLNRARRAGLIGFDVIRDDGVASFRPRARDSTAAFRRAVADNAARYRLDRQYLQSRRLWLLCEAGGMAPMLARAADPYGIPVLSSGGFDSLTAKHDLAEELASHEAPTEILHIGDHDPSGVHLFNALQEDVGAMVEGFGVPAPIFTRLAVTPAQMTAMRLPTAPPKKTDNRAFEGQTTQAEAIPPDQLSRIVTEAIEARQCPDARQRVLEREAAERAVLVMWVEAAA